MTGPPEVALNGETPCQLHPRSPARVGGKLCWDCHRTVAAALDPDNHGDRDTQAPASIPAYWGRLDAAPGRGGDESRRAPGFRSTPPCSLHVVAMRDPRSKPAVWAPMHWPDLVHDDADGEPWPIESALADMVRGMRTYLGDDQPSPVGVEALSTWLHAHVLDLTAHPHAAGIRDFLDVLVEQLRVAAGDPRDRPVGRCIEWLPVPDSRDREECGAPLYPPPPRPGVEVPAEEPVLSCRRCHRKYKGRDLVRLRLANEQGEREAAA